ncbi:AT-rich interactive domain-containing protein 3B [Salminus brasiliensis]|uniref:AT-rich interactive domain-containing protein 3B n=1 Tax=Salminus brasiliensis TaxID=930266 RepID=UPI003B832CAD
MVDNSSSGSKAQMPILSQDSGLAGVFSQAALGGSAGIKLEAVMEQLQRQQQAKLEMERKERHLREAHILYAQQLAAQQAIMASARAQGTPLAPEYFAKSSLERLPKSIQGPQVSKVSTQRSVDSVREEDDEDEADRGKGSAGEEDEDDEMVDGEEGSEDEESEGLEFLRKQSLALQQAGVGVPPYPYPVYAASPSAAKKRARSPPPKVKDEPEDSPSPTEQHSFTTPNGLADWSFDESIKQNGNASWNEESDGGRARGEASRDFAKLYELDSDPNRKEFLDDLFTFMQKRGTPVNRIPIMAKQVLDLYKLYKLVTEKGGLVEVINKKIWREITKGLNLPTSITSAAFTLRTQYMKYLYPYECEKKGLSSPGELQAAIDSNRREGRRPGYSNSLYRFSPSPSGGTPHLLSPPKMHLPASAHNGLQSTPTPALKKGTVPEDGPASMLPGRLPLALALGHQQQQLARAATLEQLRERLETGIGAAAMATGAAAMEAPERKMARLAEEQQRLLQQAFQQNLLAMASQVNPASLRMNSTSAREEKQDLSLSIASNGSASITVSIEVNGIIYSGSLYAQKSPAAMPNAATATSICQSSTLSPSIASSSSTTSSSSSKGPGSVEPAAAGSP